MNAPARMDTPVLGDRLLSGYGTHHTIQLYSSDDERLIPSEKFRPFPKMFFGTDMEI